MTLPGFGSAETPGIPSRAGPDPPSTSDPSPDRSDSGLTPEQARLLPFYHDLRNEIVEPDKVVVSTQYFWTKWAPRLGPTLTALVVCLRRHCYYNRATHERRDWCFPEQATLAREIGVETTKTIRAALGHPLATLFVRREARYVYDPARGKKIRTSDIYHVAMDDPLTPADEARLALRAAERLLDEGRGAEIVPAPSPSRRSTSQKDRQVSRRSAGQKAAQVIPSVGQFARQDSAPFSTPEVVHDKSTRTTKYNDAGLPTVIKAFGEANGTVVTPAQSARLAALCQQFDPIARRDDPLSSGAAWVRAAIHEAVESGSSYVAPRRIARICERWSIEGRPRSPRAPLAGRRGPRDSRPGVLEAQSAEDALAPEPVLIAAEPVNEGDDVDGGQARRALVPSLQADETPVCRRTPDTIECDNPSLVPAAEVDFPELGLPGRAVWQAIGDEARRRVTVPGDVALLAGSRLVGRANDRLIVAVPGRAAAQRAELRLARVLAEVTRAVLGRSVSIQFVSLGEWSDRLA
jgi:hypothetical protein